MFELTGFADEISPSLLEQLLVLQEEGVKYLEFRSVDQTNVGDLSNDQVREVKKMLDDYGIGVSAIGSPIGKSPINEDFAPCVEKAKRVIDIAHTLDARYIRMFSFFIPEGEAPATYHAEVIDRLGRLTELLAGTDLVFVHENDRGLYGDIGERCLDILQAVDSDQFRACFDPGNAVMLGANRGYADYQLVKDYLVYFHVKDAVYSLQQFVPVGEGDGELENILTDLANNKWQGFLSVEPHLGPYMPEAAGAERFRTALAALRQVLSTL